MEPVLIVSLGDDSVASSRVRAGSLEHRLVELGMNPVRVTAGRLMWPLRLMIALLSRPKLTLLQKIAPPKWFLRLIRTASSTLVFELDDAIYLGYPNQKHSPQRIRSRVQFAVHSADLTVVSNQNIADDLRPFSKQEIIVFPGPAPRVRTTCSFPKERIAIWLGSPSTFSFFSQAIYPKSEELSANGVRVVAVGASSAAQTGSIHCVPWSPEEEERALCLATVGLVPHVESDWADRKAAYKILEYLSADVVPVFDMTPAIQLLLGDNLDTIGVQVEDRDWISAINIGMEIQISNAWRTARDDVFKRWSPDNYARIFIHASNLALGHQSVR